MKVETNSALLSNSAVGLEKNKKEVNKSLENISSQRPLKGSDTAKLLIADALLADVSTYSQGIKNANDAIGMLQIADGALINISENASRLNELAVAYNNGALNEDQKRSLATEALKISESMKNSIINTTYNGKSVFGEEFTFKSGPESINLLLQAPNVSSIDIANQDSVLNFINSITNSRNSISASIKEMQSLVNSHLSAIVNSKESESKLQNNDIAENYNNLNSTLLKEKAALYANAFNYESLQKRLNALLQ